MDLVGGAVDPQSSYVSKIFHVKTKESGPVGGRPPRSANVDSPGHWRFYTTLLYNMLLLSARQFSCYEGVSP